ncbi:MAG: hypothetical protein V4491_05085, partial [Pseudomonadota bacterium]
VERDDARKRSLRVRAGDPHVSNRRRPEFRFSELLTTIRRPELVSGPIVVKSGAVSKMAAETRSA